MNPHLDQPVEVTGAALGTAAVVAVVVHGRDLDPSYMVEHLIAPLRRPGVTYVLPTADGRSWYPTSFLAPVADNEPRLGYALDRLESLRSQLEEAGIDDAAMVWVGFSQGACLVTEYVARSSHRFGGLVSLTGGLIGPSEGELSGPRSVQGLSAFFGASDVDPFVPLQRVQVTVGAFEAAGADVSSAVYPGAVHEIVGDEVKQCGHILALVESRVAES